MTTSQQHTPTPWTVSLADGKAIGQTDSGDELVYANSREDAAFIVRAVNAHEELVAALRACEAYMSTAPIFDGYLKAVDAARAALAKVAS